MQQQEQLIESVINNGNNAMFQLTGEADLLKLEIMTLRRQKIELEHQRDEILFLIVTAPLNI